MLAFQRRLVCSQGKVNISAPTGHKKKNINAQFDLAMYYLLAIYYALLAPVIMYIKEIIWKHLLGN